MKQNVATISILPMILSDVDDVLALEEANFSCPWRHQTFQTELSNRSAQYFIAKNSTSIVGYGGIWVIDTDAHITTLSVAPDFRRQGIGERILIALLNEAHYRGAQSVTLEVRKSNVAARQLYSKFGFSTTNSRLKYYVDNGEDAIVMRVNNTHCCGYRNILTHIAARLA